MKNFKWNSFFCFWLLLFTSLPSLQVKAETINYKFVWPEGVETYHQKIDVACAQFGCNAQKAKEIMRCESGGNPKAINRREQGQPSGLFQFKFQTWQSFNQKAGIPNANIWDADSQIYVATWAFSNNLSSHWACK